MVQPHVQQVLARRYAGRLAEGAGECAQRHADRCGKRRGAQRLSERLLQQPQRLPQAAPVPVVTLEEYPGQCDQKNDEMSSQQAVASRLLPQRFGFQLSNHIENPLAPLRQPELHDPAADRSRAEQDTEPRDPVQLFQRERQLIEIKEDVHQFEIPRVPVAVRLPLRNQDQITAFDGRG